MSASNKRERGSARRSTANGKNRFDKALIQAAQSGLEVVLTLAVELPWIDEDGSCTVKILEVDTYAIKVRSIRRSKRERDTWISKSFIVETEILTEAV